MRISPEEPSAEHHATEATVHEAQASRDALRLEQTERQYEFFERWRATTMHPLAQSAVLVLNERGWPDSFTAAPGSQLVRTSAVTSDEETQPKWYQWSAQRKQTFEARKRAIEDHQYLQDLVFKPLTYRWSVHHKHEGHHYPERDTWHSWRVLLGSDAQLYVENPITKLEEWSKNDLTRRYKFVRTDYVELPTDDLIVRDKILRRDVGVSAVRVIENLLETVAVQKLDS